MSPDVNEAREEVVPRSKGQQVKNRKDHGRRWRERRCRCQAPYLPFGCSVRYVPEPNAGGDVQLDHDVAASVKNIRGADMHPSTVNGVSDRVLHCESSPKVGKPIWKYTSIEQFIRALLCVIEGKACEFCAAMIGH